MNGINLNETSKESAQEKLDRAMQKVQAQNEGKSEEEFEFDIFGINFEVEE